MKSRERIVIDTNVLVSRLLLPDSISGMAVRTAADGGTLLVSDATLEELASVLARPKFDRYVSKQDRERFLFLLARIAEPVAIADRLQVCRDPKDDKFLEVAMNGSADVILSGDEDLLVLNPFRGVAIVGPADYLARLKAKE